MVQASSQKAVSGTVSISGNELAGSSTAAVQTSRYSEISSQLGFSCLDSNGENASTLTSSGRGGLAMNAETSISSFFFNNTDIVGSVLHTAPIALSLLDGIGVPVNIACLH